MARFFIDRPQYELRPGEGHVRLNGLSERDTLSLIGPGGLRRSAFGSERRDYLIEGMTGLVLGGRLYPKGTIIIQTEGRDDMAEVVDEKLQEHFAALEQARSLSEQALRAHTRRRP